MSVMKITRKDDKVEVIRNKRRGLKLLIRSSTIPSGACNHCYLWEHTNICIEEKIEGNSPCGNLDLGEECYLILKNENNNKRKSS